MKHAPGLLQAILLDLLLQSWLLMVLEGDLHSAATWVPTLSFRACLFVCIGLMALRFSPFLGLYEWKVTRALAERLGKK